MNMSKKLRKELERVRNNLKGGLDFIAKPTTAIMVETTLTSTDVFTAGYYLDKRYISINKEIGSEFTLALTAMRDLDRILDPEE